jgi:SagB-type dehydrogenase family enzyme
MNNPYPSPNSTAIFHYHNRTKHQFNAYAKAPEFLDWDEQPNPFRHFNGSETVELPLLKAELSCLFSDLDSPTNINAKPLTLENIGAMLELSFGLSAWKAFEPDRWALRCNPSSGNLHPTEVYLLCTDDSVLQTGVYHYVSHDHHLERRCEFAANNLQPAIYIGLSSIHWREAWKYGERAFRYCQHDIGHALAALSYAAACLGWEVELCSEATDAQIAQWLGLNRAEDFVKDEQETPDLFCRLRINRETHENFDANTLSQILQNAEWFGKAQPLNGRHFYRWAIIDEVSKQVEKSANTLERLQTPTFQLPELSHDLPASRLIRQRRSAQHFNGKAESLPLADFYRILSALLPNAKPPFTAWNWSPQVHLFLFVHRVEGLESGLYLLPRDSQAVAELKQTLSADFEWQKMDAPFEFYRLQSGDYKQTARTLSCYQPIAGDSAFSLGMLANFSANIESEAWRYRRLFWECGLLGQILYLEAEAAGVRGTGIGCFFDDEVLKILDVSGETWQSLYHFTIGTPLEDNRLQTFAAYEHLERN